MPEYNRFPTIEKLAFRDRNSNILESVELCTIQGVWDNQKGQWVDPPQLTSSYGNVRPDSVAEKFGIRVKK